MNTIIVVPDKYPEGAASSTHARLLARGLQAAGGDARIIGLFKTLDDRPLAEWSTDAHGIRYKLLPLLKSRLGRLGRVPRYILHMPTLYRKTIENEIINGHCDAVILFGHSWFQFMPLVKACNRVQIPVFAVCTEWWRFGRDIAPFYWDHEMFRVRLLRRASGMIAISRLWENYARSNNIPVIRIPSLSDDNFTEDFPDQKQRSEFRLVYVGNMHRRDLPSTLLAGVREAVRRGVPMRLIVVGRADVYPEAKRAQLDVRNCPALRAHVDFTGWIPDSEMQKQRRLADAFVLLRDNNWESRACFPTRLPEYLLTMRPVIISAVGDIDLFLEHRRNAWLLPPGDRPIELADAITALQADAAEVRRIGSKGRETALREFSFRVLGPKMMDFLKGFRNLMTAKTFDR